MKTNGSEDKISSTLLCGSIKMKSLLLCIVTILNNLLVYENYNRTAKLKEVLFDINKDDNEYINILELIKIFTLKVIQMDSEKHKNKTYYEVLFN